MRHLIYLPVERYKNRWTEYVSGAHGMFAHGIRAVPDVYLTTIAADNDVHEIKMGRVLDVAGRARFAFYQMERLLQRIQNGTITDNSTIYIEDFWHPGFEMLPYACHLAGVRPAVYAFCHAQSVDPNDFTYPMREWMRPMERGWANWLTGIFVAAEELADMLTGAGVASPEKVHVCGTVMRRHVLIEMGFIQPSTHRRNPTVVFASRPDPEKNPQFFVEVANKMRDASIGFVYLTGGRQLPAALARDCQAANIRVLDDNDKRSYFNYLANSAVAFNCASQDFIGYCQLDALAAGCPPLCPEYLTFPTLLQRDSKYLYKWGDLDDACGHVQNLVDSVAGTLAGSLPVPPLYQRFGSYYEGSVGRMLNVMFGLQEQPASS